MDYKPLFIALIFILFVGIMVPLLADDLGADTPAENSILSPLINLVDNGIDIFTFSFNPFALFGLNEYIADYLTAFSYIPNIILIPMIILMVTAIAYTLIKLLPTT